MTFLYGTRRYLLKFEAFASSKARWREIWVHDRLEEHLRRSDITNFNWFTITRRLMWQTIGENIFEISLHGDRDVVYLFISLSLCLN